MKVQAPPAGIRGVALESVRDLTQPAIRVDAGAIASWLVAFTLVSYLAMRGGGYDIVARSQVGLLVWWGVLLVALTTLLPTRIGRLGWLAIGLFAAFALWTGLAISWSESAERSVSELGRVATYLGVLVLGLLVQGRTATRHAVNGLACAVGLVTVLAVLSRLHPQAFPADPHVQFLPFSTRKLSYPLGYWNALADFAALGVPLLLSVAVSARTAAARAAAAAVLPMSALCIYLAISRGGVIALGIGIAVLLMLVPRRLETFVTLAVGAAGATVLLRATASRPALTRGIVTHTAIHQGNRVLALSLAVCAGVAVFQVAIIAALRRRRSRWLAPGRRATARRAGLAAVAGLLVAMLLGVPGKLEHAWHDFKQPSGVVVPRSDTSIFSRLQAANGNSRYQFWQSALQANATHPWRGVGPGTFQSWWTQHPTAPGFIRNAHSLYFETLAETGIVGFALLTGMLLLFVAVALRRALTEGPDTRLPLAGASAALAVFLFSAAVEWVWQLAVFAAIALLLGAVILGGRGDSSPPAPAAARLPSRAARFALRGVLVLLAILSLTAVVIPLSGQLALRSSDAAAARGQLGLAYADSRAAAQLQPYASSAYLQQALVLEAAGQLRRAAAAARVATHDSPTDWTAWLTLARIDARRGADQAALSELHRTRELNPRFSLFSLT